MARMVSRMTHALFCSVTLLISLIRIICERSYLGAATQQVKPRRVAANQAGAERVSNPRLSGTIFCLAVVGSKQDFRFSR